MIVTNYVVQLDAFSGPLDVLLHLIQKTKIDIMEISIAEITDQYIQYLESLKALDLEIASEYLLMSAQLIEMKSKMLLPKVKNADDVEEDPREALIQRLLEYKKYKDVITTLRTYELERQQVFSKPLSDISDWMQHETVLNNTSRKDIYQLVRVFEKMLARRELMQTKNVTMKKQEISIEDQIDYITVTIKKYKRVKLSEIIQDFSRPYIVTTFLAMLQLIRMQKIHVVQDERFDDIEIFTD